MRGAQRGLRSSASSVRELAVRCATTAFYFTLSPEHDGTYVDVNAAHIFLSEFSHGAGGRSSRAKTQFGTLSMTGKIAIDVESASTDDMRSYLDELRATIKKALGGQWGSKVDNEYRHCLNSFLWDVEVMPRLKKVRAQLQEKFGFAQGDLRVYQSDMFHTLERLAERANVSGASSKFGAHPVHAMANWVNRLRLLNMSERNIAMQGPHIAKELAHVWTPSTGKKKPETLRKLMLQAVANVAQRPSVFSPEKDVDEAQLAYDGEEVTATIFPEIAQWELQALQETVSCTYHTDFFYAPLDKRIDIFRQINAPFATFIPARDDGSGKSKWDKIRPLVKKTGHYVTDTLADIGVRVIDHDLHE